MFKFNVKKAVRQPSIKGTVLIGAVQTQTLGGNDGGYMDTPSPFRRTPSLDAN